MMAVRALEHMQAFRWRVGNNAGDNQHPRRPDENFFMGGGR